MLLDITASSDARGIMLDIVSRVAEKIFIPFTVGGGIRTVEDFTQLLRAGADKVSVNSAAIKRPEIINEAAYKFGSQCVVVAVKQAAGMSILTADESIWESMLWNGPWKRNAGARERFC